jgi:PTH2 family peptidyl-tRNA hydrolase
MSRKRNDRNQDEDDQHVMYVLVNNDLKMQKGKIASQCMHSACHVTRILERQNPKNRDYARWIKEAEAKIVLRSSLSEMQSLIDQYEVDVRVKRGSEDIWCCYIRDCGRTQIPANSLTTLAFKPMPKSKAPTEVKKMKCL